MQYCGLSNKGKVRGNNEDFFYVPEIDGIQVFVVCDGMGGENAGEIASALAVSEIVVYIEENFNEKDRALLLRKALLNANKTVLDTAKSDNRYDSMGTTAVCALPENDKVYIANVGDSRLYLFNGESLKLITRDHSFVEELVRSGVITREQAETHPQRNILMRAVGTSPFIKADTGIVEWKDGDIIMLCSDGLHGSMNISLAEEILSSESNLLTACDRLTDAALAAGSSDNVTVVLVKNAGGIGA